ncbi:hypothetical protein [Paenibacillus methanolicus]|uniref:Uncharacterized protein n=1 Tax=Paenibacillus methanolicus TaxID=582686 RepID=A0A5S5C7K1_9BACL|nr:hypothetical protein [Paenibacillus methanolicus]TYP73963.1 hypothetical protein BCM02_106242 [Paenibacillus methanolicus]
MNEQLMQEAPMVTLSELVGDANVRELLDNMQAMTRQELEDLMDSLEVLALHAY